MIFIVSNVSNPIKFSKLCTDGHKCNYKYSIHEYITRAMWEEDIATKPQVYLQ